MIGTTIAHYKVLEKLGQGGMGAVYKAEDTRLNRMVALKFLAAPPAESGNLESRFLHEARAAAALDHPNICGIYEINVFEGQLYMAMPLVDGESLEKRIAAGPRPLKEVVAIAIQTAEALEEAHRKEIVHRDIKPANILVIERERTRLQVKLLDFGLARLAQATKLTREGATLGTAAYMSPGQAEGRSVDLRTDVWSLGVVLYEMVSGRLPFPAEYEQALFYGILNETPEPLTSLRSGVPMELERIVNKCLAKSPDQRYQSMTDLLVDLNALLDALGRSQAESGRRTPAATLPDAPQSGALQSAPERKAPAWLWLLAGVPLGALALWALWKPQAPAAMLHTAYALDRVSWDGQMTGFPALSADGTLLAFSSDRAGQGDLDLWVKQVNGGALVRLTDHPADEMQAAFSPDGSLLVFYRSGDGVYTIPALGGEPYLVAAGASSPAFAPDGKRIAYLHDDALYVSPISMGEPKRLLAGVSNSSTPLWTPDGQSVLLAARIGEEELDWWAVPVDGSEPRNLGARKVFDQAGRQVPMLDVWSWLGDSLVYENGQAELARIGFNRNQLRIEGPEELLTVGAGVEIQPSIAAEGVVAFTNAWQRRDVWSLPVGGGEPVRLTTAESNDTAGDISPDGKRMVYLSNRWGESDIWTLDFPTGQELNLTSDDAVQQYPILSRDGERVAYLTEEEGKQAIYVRPFTGGVGRRLCADCGPPRDWSPDGKTVIFDRTDPPSVAVLDVESGGNSELLIAPGCRPQNTRYSPKGEAVVFDLQCLAEGSGLFAARLGAGPIDRDAWVRLTDAADDAQPVWDPAGDRIYFLARRGGSLGIWTQRLDSATLAPVGRPEVLRRFPHARYSLDLMQAGDRRLSIGGGRLVFPLSEVGGSVWLMQPTPNQPHH